MTNMNPVFETARLLLRKQTEADQDDLYAILGDAQTMRYYPRPYTREEALIWIQRSMREYKEHGFGLWAMILKETGDFIGQCGIFHVDIDGEQLPEIAYHIHRDHHRMGYATEAARGALRYGFETVGLDEIFIHTYVQNIPSRRVAEKLGMTLRKEFEKDLRKYGYDVIWRHVVYSMRR